MRDRQLRRLVDGLAGPGPARSLRPPAWHFWRRWTGVRRPADDDQAAGLRAAIALRAARPDSAAPTEEFVTALHDRLAAALDGPEPVSAAGRAASTRRRVVQGVALVVPSLAAGFLLGRPRPESAGSEGEALPGGPDLVPNAGSWHTVTGAAALAEGEVRGFDVGTVRGFVARTSGRLVAVSGVCTHRGCLLEPDGGQLVCPCHRAAFSLDGDVLHCQLASAPPRLPRIAVREAADAVQVFAPD
jgi:cytochrome b6-f complex iron-sulfur subunit